MKKNLYAIPTRDVVWQRWYKACASSYERAGSIIAGVYSTIGTAAYVIGSQNQVGDGVAFGIFSGLMVSMPCIILWVEAGDNSLSGGFPAKLDELEATAKDLDKRLARAGAKGQKTWASRINDVREDMWETLVARRDCFSRIQATARKSKNLLGDDLSRESAFWYISPEGLEALAARGDSLPLVNVFAAYGAELANIEERNKLLVEKAFQLGEAMAAEMELSPAHLGKLWKATPAGRVLPSNEALREELEHDAELLASRKSKIAELTADDHRLMV